MTCVYIIPESPFHDTVLSSIKNINNNNKTISSQYALPSLAS